MFEFGNGGAEGQCAGEEDCETGEGEEGEGEGASEVCFKV